jgi:hypothetical protein
MVDQALAARCGWKLGDRVVLIRNLFPANLELTIRGIYTIDPPINAALFQRQVPGRVP